MTDRFEVSRQIAVPPSTVFALLTDPAEGGRVERAGDRFVVHMDRESLGDLPMGRYDGSNQEPDVPLGRLA